MYCIPSALIKKQCRKKEGIGAIISFVNSRLVTQDAYKEFEISKRVRMTMIRSSWVGHGGRVTDSL